MGLIKNEHGVFHVRRKVPKALEVATARAMGVPKERVSWLKETLGTKDEKQAKVLAKPVMDGVWIGFAKVEAYITSQRPKSDDGRASWRQKSKLLLNGGDGVPKVTELLSSFASDRSGIFPIAPNGYCDC